MEGKNCSEQTQLTEANRKLRALQKEYDALDKKYKVLSRSFFGRKQLQIWKGKNFLRNLFKKTPKQPKKKALPEENPILGKEVSAKELPTISVVIPTYKKNEWLDLAIRSCLEQDYPAEKIEIIVAVNGADAEYAAWLTAEYKAYPQIRVVHTFTPGAGAGRNLGKKFVRTEFMTYLDDDDYFTKGYLMELVGYIAEGVDVVCGRTVDLLPDGTLNEDNYLNNAVSRFAGTVAETPWSLSGPLFTTVWMKLYRTSQVVDVWGDFDEARPYTEDVVFWVENIHKPIGKIAVVSAGSKESYVRRVTDVSRSRPSREKSFDFYVSGRIILMERFVKELLRQDRPMGYKNFVKQKIDAAQGHLDRYYSSCDADGKRRILDVVKQSDCLFLNKSKLGLVPAIAFCHNFSPAIDASAMVAAKRLSQISDYVGDVLNWTVVCADMSYSREEDPLWDAFYAKYQYTEKRVVGGRTYFHALSQIQWAEKAVAMVEDIEATYIYSRSMWVGSHAAARAYKQKHPNTVWIAEFSDPVYMGTDNRPRPVGTQYVGEYAYLNTFWQDIERAVFCEADKVIFTNENQRRFMLEHNPVEADVVGKSLVWQHPVIHSDYAEIIPTDYQVDPTVINVGYFGTFYKNRTADEMLGLLGNPAVHLHIFTNATTEQMQGLQNLFGRLHINPQVPCLEMLSIAKKMDYLYLNDIRFAGPYTPYLPSKLADYLSAGRPVLCRTYPNTPMSEMEHERLIKLDTMDGAFAATLTKQ